MNSKMIKETVESTFNTFIDVKSRRRDITYMRAIYYKLCKEFTLEPLHRIGKTINRNHATVLNGLKTFEHVIDNFWEKEYFDHYIIIKNHLKTKATLKIKKSNPDKFYKNKYRIKLLQNRKLYNHNKKCIKMLEQMNFKYFNKLKIELNSITNDKKYVAK